MAAKACPVCYQREHCLPSCETLLWQDTGTRRGDNPGVPPFESMLLGDEMGKIFKDVKTVNLDVEEA